MFSIWETIFETWEWKEELIEGFAKEMFGVKYKEKEAGLQKKKKRQSSEDSGAQKRKSKGNISKITDDLPYRAH